MASWKSMARSTMEPAAMSGFFARSTGTDMGRDAGCGKKGWGEEGKQKQTREIATCKSNDFSIRWCGH